MYAIELPGTFTYTQARQVGLSKRALYALRDSGQIQAIGRGLYRRTDAPLADLDLIAIAERAPEATLCLTSALARHDLTDAIADRHDIALPRHRRHPTVDAPVRWHRFDATTFTIGRDLLSLDPDSTIGIYDAPRSITDAFRMRGQLGPDLAYHALRRWLRAGSHPADLLRTAKHFPAALPAIRHALEVLA